MNSQQFGCPNETKIVTVSVNLPTGTRDTPHGPTPSENQSPPRMIAHMACPVPGGQPCTHVHVSKAKWIRLFTCMNMCVHAHMCL